MINQLSYRTRHPLAVTLMFFSSTTPCHEHSTKFLENPSWSGPGKGATHSIIELGSDMVGDDVILLAAASHSITR